MSGRRLREEDPDTSIIPPESKRTNPTATPETPTRSSSRGKTTTENLQVLSYTKGGRLISVTQDPSNKLISGTETETQNEQTKSHLAEIIERPKRNETTVQETIYENNEEESTEERLAKLTRHLANTTTPRPNARPRSNILRPSPLGNFGASTSNVWTQEEQLNASYKNITVDEDSDSDSDSRGSVQAIQAGSALIEFKRSSNFVLTQNETASIQKQKILQTNIIKTKGQTRHL